MTSSAFFAARRRTSRSTRRNGWLPCHFTRSAYSVSLDWHQTIVFLFLTDHAPLCLGKNACSVFLFILLFDVNSHFFSLFRSRFYFVYSRLTIQFSLFHLFFPLHPHSPLALQAVVVCIYSPLFAILQSTLQKTIRETVRV